MNKSIQELEAAYQEAQAYHDETNQQLQQLEAQKKALNARSIVAEMAGDESEEAKIEAEYDLLSRVMLTLCFLQCR